MSIDRPKIILDCDPGLDDAMAILVAAQHTDLLGITSVSGNAPLSATTRNALLVSQIAGIDIEVHAGADRPLIVEPKHAAHVHGEGGLNGPTLPPLDRAPTSNDAVQFIVETLRSTDDVWLVPIGPLTNIALAFRQAPDIVDKVAGISLMGGSTGGGNVQPVAEFNIWADPHAAQIVFASGAKRIVMAGLNLTHQYTVDRDLAARLTGIGTVVGTFAGEVIEACVDFSERVRGASTSPLHDPCAVLAITHPQHFGSVKRHVDVSLSDITVGMTVVDERGYDNTNANVEVLYEIDHGPTIEIFVESVGAFS